LAAMPTGAIARTVVNGAPADTVDARDRGFTLGDGVFETMRVTDGRVVAWSQHMARLRSGCRALGFDAPTETTLASDARAALEAGDEGVLRLTVTRGIGPRGYAPPAHPEPTRVATFQPGLPEPPRTGLRLRWCQTLLASHPQLARWKHLNRLEQVIARSEWDDPAIAEGLMCSIDGRLIECSSSNIFWVRGGALITPDLRDCGVAGVMRGQVIETAQTLGWRVVVRDAAPDELADADEVFITSAVRRIAPVERLASQQWDAPGALTRRLQQAVDAQP